MTTGCPLCGNGKRKPTTLTEQVETVIVWHLHKGRVPSNAQAACELGMGVRTLARNLSKEGTTFIEVVRRLRRQLALAYLKNDRMQVSQIAWLLGYDETSSFSNACKKWFGKSPRELRCTLKEAA